MTDELPLLKSGEPAGDAPVRTKVSDSWLFVTNHLNMMYMLSTGLVMPPHGFADKYYEDTLNSFPGWIPLFIDQIPLETIELSTREARYLKPTIIDFDLSKLSGQLMFLGKDNIREGHFPDQLDENDYAILVPAPLPTSWIKTVVFESDKDIEACSEGAKDFDNVPLEDVRCESKRKAIFTAKSSTVSWPPKEGPPERPVPLQEPLAAGGIMAMMLLFANMGDVAVRMCRYAFDPEGSMKEQAGDHPIFSGLRTWMHTGVASLPAEVEKNRVKDRDTFQTWFFWKSVEELVEWRKAGQSGGSAGAEDILINNLEEVSAELRPQLRRGIKKLHDTLTSLKGLADATVSELFERHNAPLARAMTLFFLREKCSDLLDISNDKLDEADWLAAAILFGVRDGWQKLSLRLRSHPRLRSAVSHRMAHMAHRIAGTDISLGKSPDRIRPLLELLSDGSAWKSSEKKAALTLARESKWDCIRTRITLGQGEYGITVQENSVNIDLRGEPKINSEIELDRFFNYLSKACMDPEVEAGIRKALGKTLE